MKFKLLGRRPHLAYAIHADMEHHIKNESYETAQLYKDMAKRFKKEIIDFDKFHK
tara:strand:+ start:204 stop:368 length:165 start_codon:yes stop_codon:yes gene_type:complete